MRTHVHVPVVSSAERLAATLHTRTQAYVCRNVHTRVYRRLSDLAAPTARSHRLFEATAGARNERVCRNTLADRAVPITGRAIYEGSLDLAEAQAYCDEVDAQ